MTAPMTPEESPKEQVERLFPGLGDRPGAMTPERVALHQKTRLEAAMVEAIARHGYAETSVRELVTLAGVSKSTFYNHFTNKQECFLATFEAIVEQLSERVIAAYGRPEEYRAKLVAALSEFMRLAVDEPAAAALVAVDSLTLGAAGVAHREHASERFEVLLTQGLDQVPGAAAMPPTAPRAVVAGVRAIAYWRLRSGEQAELPSLVEPLVDWSLSYLRPPGD